MHAMCCPPPPTPRSGGVEELEVGPEDCFKRSFFFFFLRGRF